MLGVAAVLVALCLSLSAPSRLGPPAVCRAVAMTSAVRNLSLALFIATPSGAAVVLALLVYGLVMYALSVPVAVRLGRAAG
jgi:BASS family bile acid:Na+ symporter